MVKLMWKVELFCDTEVLWKVKLLHDAEVGHVCDLWPRMSFGIGKFSNVCTLSQYKFIWNYSWMK